MATIGLLDWDLTRWRQPTVFNIDLMKLAYYHKVKQRDVVEMEQKFFSDFCSKVYIQKDYEDFEYPTYITEDPKVVWSGLAVNEGHFAPLPEEIEVCPADTTIYNKMSKYYAGHADNKSAYNNMMKAVHFRLSRDGETLATNWDKQMQPRDKNKVAHFICHDLNLTNICGAYEAIDSIAAEYGRKNFRLGFKFPLRIYSVDELLKWGSVTKTPGVSNAYLYTLMPDEALVELTYFKQQFTYLITNDYWTRETFIGALPKILIQAIFL